MMRKLLLLMLWVVIVPVFPVLAEAQVEPLEWQVDSNEYSGFLVRPDKPNPEPLPGVVMVPNWMGVTEAAVDKARQLADDDYVVLVVDMYGKGVRPRNAQEAKQQAEALYADRSTLRRRIHEAVNVLRRQSQVDSKRIAAIGFCFGGTTVLELARDGADVRGVVSLHGGLTTPRPAMENTVQASVLVLNGAADSSVSMQDIERFQAEMTGGGADWQFVNFGGAVHCFAEETAASPPNCLYDRRAARRAYRIMSGFLNELFDN